MKIALLSEYFDIGGGESNLLEVAAELSQHEDVEVALVCFGALYHEAKRRNINAIEINLQGRRWVKGLPILTIDRRLRSVLDKFDIVHAYSINLLPRLFYLTKPLIWTNHGYWERPRGFRAKVISHLVDHVVVVSNDVCEGAKEITSGKSVVPLGVRLSRFSNIPHPTTGSEFNILCIGRFQNIKGQDLLVRAMADVATESHNFSSINVHFVGDVNGSDPNDHAFMQEVRVLAKSRSLSHINIHFHGFQSDINPHLKAANLVVIPSRYESFSMVAIEALSAGRPVIAPDVGGPAEIINSRKIGLLFSPGDHFSLAAAIKTALNSYSTFDIKSCIARGEDFSVRKQALSLMNIYSRAINAKNISG